MDAQNSGFISEYTLFDAGVSYKSKLFGTPLTYRLTGKNLTDKYYYSSVYTNGLEVGRCR